MMEMDWSDIHTPLMLLTHYKDATDKQLSIRPSNHRMGIDSIFQYRMLYGWIVKLWNC